MGKVLASVGASNWLKANQHFPQLPLFSDAIAGDAPERGAFRAPQAVEGNGKLCLRIKFKAMLLLQAELMHLELGLKALSIEDVGVRE
jgi:hypothetical protein